MFRPAAADSKVDSKAAPDLLQVNGEADASLEVERGVAPAVWDIQRIPGLLDALEHRDALGPERRCDCGDPHRAGRRVERGVLRRDEKPMLSAVRQQVDGILVHARVCVT